MDIIMTLFAKRAAIRNIKAKFWKISERLNVVGDQITAGRVAAVLAREVIPKKNVVPPSFILRAKPEATSFGNLSVFVRMAIRTTNRSFSDNRANLGACLSGMFSASPITPPLLCGNAHFETGFRTHNLSLHWRHKARKSLNPPTLSGLTSFFASKCHG
jgi:hypothetical protein